MPTGYTAGIIDGTTETFEDFVKHCMRAFGATIHMRDDNMDKVYEPMMPSTFHTEELQKAKNILLQAEKLTDSELIEMRKKELNKSKRYHIKSINAIKSARKKLDEFLVKAKAFEPPTPDHNGIAKFMIEQLEGSISADGCPDYHDNELCKIDFKLKNINANEIRFRLIEDTKRDITYHLKEYKKELDRCVASNKWVTDLLSALG